MNWINYFNEIAETVKKKSKDKSTKIGAVIVGRDNEIISTGYNSFPRGLRDEVAERHERPEKYNWFEHAERNAIYNAARIGVSVKGSSMYLTCGVPCIDCARGIINSGINTVYCVKGDTEDIAHGLKGDHWEENITKAWKMLNECGVKVKFYEDEVKPKSPKGKIRKEGGEEYKLFGTKIKQTLEYFKNNIIDR